MKAQAQIQAIRASACTIPTDKPARSVPAGTGIELKRQDADSYKVSGD